MSEQTAFSSFDVPSMSPADSYKLLASLVMPRPIAWITTINAGGVVNAAPFSFFNMISADPPLLAVGFSAASDRNGKDTLANIRLSGELVVNLVPEELTQQMNITAVNAPRDTDELALAGLEAAPSAQVKPPRIAAAPVALECRTWQILEPGPDSSILLARVLQANVRKDAFVDERRLHIDPGMLRLIGRMHGGGGGSYCTTRDLFQLDRPVWPIGKDNEASSRLPSS